LAACYLKDFGGVMKKILILGATSAIAQAVAKRFASKGGSLFLVARDKEKLKAIEDDLRVRGAKIVESKVADLNDCSKHQEIIDSAIQVLSGLDVALIAYGVLGDKAACEEDYLLAEKILKTNFLSVISLSILLKKYFMKQKKGCLAVISSVAGDRGRQSNYIYGSSKGGLNIFLGGLRNRLAPFGVQVLTINPGFVDTPMTADMKKGILFVSPDFIAKGIDRAITKGKDIVYLPWVWRPIMIVIRMIPEFIFKKLRL
jgi:short-subunit dehydrogenase